MAVTQISDANSKEQEEEAIGPSSIEGADNAGPSELTRLRKTGGDPNRCSDKGPNGNQGTNRGRVKTYKLSEKRKKDNQDSLSDIDDSEVVGYLITKEAINYKRILWEAMNRNYTEAKKQKRTTETKKGAPVKKAAKTTEKVELRKPSSKINYDALKLIDDELDQGSETVQVVGADSSYAHRTEDSPYENISRHGSDDDCYNEDQHDISYGEDNETIDYRDGGYEYEDEHYNDEIFDF
ncbi:hypothetical protein PHJA_002708000 [Phtheirospermum japonicum]|uniref:Brf1 TBP-binding domain-containing protein n=1 Tax=Phtheirospermum japonicum TaxID=374723 RepID=A0A830D735_9LAMI|nr:hypothetical protein PHJA_002708000 [Phtheirospermum japonicum]